MPKYLKTILFIFILPTIALFGNDAPVLTIYITRHAQRGARTLWVEQDREKHTIGETINGVYSPVKENSITPLGEKQSAILGAWLKKQGFKGRIHSSASFWTIQTAVGIAAAISPEMQVIPEPQMQSQAVRSAPAKSLTCAELQKRFPKRIVTGEYPEMWLLCGETDKALTAKRMEAFLAELLKKEPKGEILLVGHSSSLPFVVQALNRKCLPGVTPLNTSGLVNCCLFVYKLNKDGKVCYASLDTDKYMPAEMKTSNFSK